MTDVDPTVPVEPSPPASVREAVAVQRESFGGLRWGCAFFGWLSANGLAVLLVAVLSVAGVAIGLTQGVSSATIQRRASLAADGSLDPISVAGALALLVALFVSYYAGGYVAGRMARFDGARQGTGVWLIGLAVVVVLAVLGAVFGAQYNLFNQLDLPRIPVDEGQATVGGVTALAAVLVVTWVGAVVGGKAGEHFHRRVDRLAFRPVPAPEAVEPVEPVEPTR
ncbi:hypothetical protein ACIB24_00630 [Spongisporangium articulatum]|uniref:Major facilitator superfamily (MFS) profile domain-containing protein n=1 Tax=Spongisporangium articulatum TaxID=3362603 RepID=A0ABW8AGT5_9ACTN